MTDDLDELLRLIPALRGAIDRRIDARVDDLLNSRLGNLVRDGAVNLTGGVGTVPTSTLPSGEYTGTDFKATGLTGATAASRYAGATASGAPASGTFAKGDFVIDQTVSLRVCTIAGTPGTWTQLAAGFANPMTTVGDIIVGGTAGTPTRVAKGGNNTVWGVDGSGVLGYKADPTGSGGYTKNLLDYIAASDLANGLSLAATTWTDIGTNQSFTVDDASAEIAIQVDRCILVGNSNAGARIVIDSAGTPINIFLGGNAAASGVFANVLAGAGVVRLAAGTLSAATHTVKVQVYADRPTTCYCRASTAPSGEGLRIEVWERK